MREYHYSLRSCHRRSRHPVSGGIRNRDESLVGKRRRLSFYRVVALTFGGLPFRADRGFPRQYAIRLSKSGGGKYAFTSIGKIIGASELVLRRSRKNSPHPVFHTFFALDHLKIALFTKSLQITRGLSCKKKRMSVIFGCQRHGCQASFSVVLHLIATGKAKVHPLTSTGKKIGVSTTVLKFSSKNFSLHSCSQENRRFDYRFRKVP